ncbi:hypothetical protein BJG93_01640 [Paraburkholderia sprentiae WSM5005]|uniref:Uncharacterized protein n=2 Tax=Paraburkholderia sprentiae TaxID=948107 RepID=A0A1I9YKK2_9BURK|nr:protein YgfX [Paraburkholderia sprentiae]APA86835.1 hypothetical protein BJG93_01640 [Paraburkholderia sprentiae WSM5005]
MRAALVAFVLIATLAVHICAAPRLGAWQTVPLTLAVAALLALCAARHEAAQPVALHIAMGEVSAWNRTGVLLARGRVVGCAQWSGRLLVLALESEGGRRGGLTRAPTGRARSLLVTADALPATVFRELSVLGRRAAGA